MFRGARVGRNTSGLMSSSETKRAYNRTIYNPFNCLFCSARWRNTVILLNLRLLEQNREPDQQIGAGGAGRGRNMGGG